MSENLDELRREIDGIDQKMVELFKRRMEVVTQVAAYKKERGLPILDASRERALLGKVGQAAGDELADYIQSVYRTLLAASRSYETEKLGQESQV